MRKSDIGLIFVIGLMFIATAYFLLAWVEEQELTARLIDNIQSVSYSEINCSELLMGIDGIDENTPDHDKIMNALKTKYEELECQK